MPLIRHTTHEKIKRWVRFSFARIGDFLFLIQAGMVISLGLVVVGALLILLNAAIPMPSFFERQISSIAVFGAELSSRILALALAICLTMIWLWQRGRN